MGVAAGPYNPRDGLILWYDIANIKSFAGEPTTNLVSNPTMVPSDPSASVVSSSTTATNVGGSGWNWNYYEDINISANGGMEWLPNEPDPLGSKGVWKMKKRAGGNGESNWNPSSAPGAIDQTKTYIFTVYCKTSVADTARIHLNVTKNGASDWSYASGYHVGNNKWQRLELIIPGGSGVTSINVVRCQSVGTSINTDILWKYYQIEQKTYTTAFVSGTRGTTVATGGGIIDLSGGVNSGELVNGPTYSSTFGGVISFDGTNDYVKLPSISLTSITVSVWVKSSSWSTQGHPMIFAKGINVEWILWKSDDSSYDEKFGWRGSATIYSTTTAQNNVWYHLVASIGSAGMKLYVNGALEASNGTTTFSSGSNPIALGTGITNNTPSNYLLGDISIPQIWSRQLSDTQVKDVYNATRVRFQNRQSLVTSGLVLHLEISNRDSYNGSGTIVTDLSGYGNNGTLTNGPVYKTGSGGHIQLDGTNDYIVIPHNSIFNFGTGGFTIILVISSEQLKGYTAYIKKGGPTEWGNSPAGWYATSANGVGDLAWYWVFANGTSHTEIPPASTFSKSNDTFGLNFFSISRDGSGNIYRCWNGVYELAATNWTSSFDNSSDIWIGRGNTNYLKGKFPMLLIYNRALTQSEVLQNFEATRARFGL